MMRKFTLTAIAMLSGLMGWAQSNSNTIANETKFEFGTMNVNWEEVSGASYANETTPTTPTTGIDVYIHTDGNKVPNVYAWDLSNTDNKLNGTWPGDKVSDLRYVAVIGDENNKKDYFKIHFDANRVGLIVNFNGNADQTNNMYIEGAGSYFFDYVSYTGYSLDRSTKDVTSYTLAPSNDYYTGGTDKNNNTIYVKMNTTDFTPTVYCYSNWDKPWDAYWAHSQMESTAVNGESGWWKKNFSHSEIYGQKWDPTLGKNVWTGGLILSNGTDTGTQTCDITWLGGGDYFFYYYPYDMGDKFEPVVMMNGRQNNYKEWTFDATPWVGTDFAVTLLDPNTLQFATIAKDGFTLTINDPSGMSVTDCIVDGQLRLNVGATFTLKQNDGHIINMFAIDGVYQNNATIKHDQMLMKGQLGYFGANSVVTKVIDKHGNDYSKYGDYEHVYTSQTPEVSFTYTNKDYGINNQYIAFNSITVRDARISTGLADQYAATRFFYWEITNPMSIVRYAPEEGVLYCRSLAESTTWTHPRPTAEQVEAGMVADDVDTFTNYDWIALYLDDEQMKKWEETYKFDVDYVNHVIAGNSIKGYYCDFAIDAEGSASLNAPRRERSGQAVSSYEAVAYLNPTIKLTELPVVTDELEPTKLNTYTPFNFVLQDNVFFLPPKRNEVCNINYTIPADDRASLFGTKYSFNGEEIQARVRVHGENTPELFDKMGFSSTYDYCRTHSTSMIHEGVVQMVYIAMLNTVDWEWHDEEDSQGNHNTFWMPQPGAGTFELPEVYDPDSENKQTWYYDVYVNQLAINPVLAAKRTVNTWTAVEEIAHAGKTAIATDYYNMAGMRSGEAHDGFNIVVTRYSDGTTSVRKTMVDK